MACSDEVFEAAKVIVKAKKKNEFTIREVREYLKKQKSEYAENTIRGQIVATCNTDSKKNKYPYFKKDKGVRGGYKLVDY